jgi:hypothetical protein
MGRLAAKKPASALAETGDQLMIQRSVHAGQLLLLQASAVTADSFSRFTSVGRSYVFVIESPCHQLAGHECPDGTSVVKQNLDANSDHDCCLVAGDETRD